MLPCVRSEHATTIRSHEGRDEPHLTVPDPGEDFAAHPVELFFDLAFVFAFSQLVVRLVEDPDAEGVIAALTLPDLELRGLVLLVIVDTVLLAMLAAEHVRLERRSARLLAAAD